MKLSKRQHFTLQQWLDWQTQLHSQPIDMGLDRIRPVFSQLLAQSSLATKIILVAGTNGKGSTVAFLESLYVSGGYRVGTYTSPHLLRYNERVRINGTPVSDKQLCTAFENVENARGETSLTYFEFGTLAAFDIFAEQDRINEKLDIVILEVGLGGRLDAVNLVNADIAIVTNIQLDHIDWLGDTREKIAVEKLGVARKNRPLIIADDNLPENILPLLAEKEAVAYLLGKDFGFTHQLSLPSANNGVSNSWDWWADVKDGDHEQGAIEKEPRHQKLRHLKTRHQKHSLPVPALRGAHQFKNAAAALTVTAILNNILPLSMNHIRVGLGNVSLPGRFQIERVEDHTVIFDVAHNPHGIKAFIQNLKQLPAIGETYLVFAMLKDKSIKEVVFLLDNEVDHWYLTSLDNDRALAVDDLASIISGVIETDVTTKEVSIERFPTVLEGCQYALQKMQSNDKLLVVGSFFTVSEALAICD